MIAKCQCQHCGQPIEFEVQDAGRTVNCPHCNLAMVLTMPAMAMLPTKQKRKPQNSWGFHLGSALFFVIGMGFMLVGCVGNMDAQSAIQQSPACIEMGTGILLCSISVIIGLLAKIADAIANK